MGVPLSVVDILKNHSLPLRENEYKMQPEVTTAVGIREELNNWSGHSIFLGDVCFSETWKHPDLTPEFVQIVSITFPGVIALRLYMSCLGVTQLHLLQRAITIHPYTCTRQVAWQLWTLNGPHSILHILVFDIRSQNELCLLSVEYLHSDHRTDSNDRYKELTNKHNSAVMTLDDWILISWTLGARSLHRCWNQSSVDWFCGW